MPRFLRQNAHWLIVAALVGAAYARTLAPGLSWANRGADGGDFITAAATGGVAHPSGYPTYLALARLFQLLPLGTLAFRTNLLSAVCAVAAAVLVTRWVARQQRVTGAPFDGEIAQISGALAGLAFGLSPLLWSQAVITEVHALHALFLALLLTLAPLARPHPETSGWVDLAAGLLAGLALGNHLTAALLLPAWFGLSLLRRIPDGAPLARWLPQMAWRPVLRGLAGLALGASIYLTLLLRARSGAPVNWGDPVGWDGLRWLISGQLYRDRLFTLPADFVLPRVQSWAALLLAQFGLPGFALALAGLFFGRPRSPRLFWITGWMAAAYTAFAIGYNATDSYAYLIPVFLAVAVWLGLGAGALLEAAARRGGPGRGRVLGAFAALAVAALLLINAASNLPALDASRDDRAEQFGRAVLAAAPPGALLFPQGDEQTFALWYFHFALRQRPDVAVINEALLPYDWYRASLRRAYPDLPLPDHPGPSGWPATLTAATGRPACHPQTDAPATLFCSP